MNNSSFYLHLGRGFVSYLNNDLIIKFKNWFHSHHPFVDRFKLNLNFEMLGSM